MRVLISFRKPWISVVIAVFVVLTGLIVGFFILFLELHHAFPIQLLFNFGLPLRLQCLDVFPGFFDRFQSLQFLFF